MIYFKTLCVWIVCLYFCMCSVSL